MRSTHWMAGLLLAVLPLTTLAVEADGGKASTQDGEQLQRTAVNLPAAHPLLGEMQAIESERETFSRDFDWGTPEQRGDRLQAFSQAMAEFDRRALQMKSDWLRSEGRLAEAEALEARLNRPEQREKRPERSLDRATGEETGAVRQEAVR